MPDPTSTPLPPSVLYHREHYQQKRSWDCGVSCVIMAVTDLQKRSELLLTLDQVVREEGFGQSTWTIDLCYFLKR